MFPEPSTAAPVGPLKRAAAPAPSTLPGLSRSPARSSRLGAGTPASFVLLSLRFGSPSLPPPPGSSGDRPQEAATSATRHGPNDVLRIFFLLITLWKAPFGRASAISESSRDGEPGRRRHDVHARVDRGVRPVVAAAQ